MEVNFPEPVGLEVSLYKLDTKKRFELEELRNLLIRAERDLDEICENELKDDKYSVICYNILIQRIDNSKILGNIMHGGFDLSVEEGRKIALPEFKNRYKESFKSALAELEYNSCELSLDFSVVGFRDKITRKIQAFDPYSYK